MRSFSPHTVLIGIFWIYLCVPANPPLFANDASEFLHPLQPKWIEAICSSISPTHSSGKAMLAYKDFFLTGAIQEMKPQFG